MHVLVHDPFVIDIPMPIERAGLQEVLAAADVVFPLAPATPETENLIGQAELASIKPGVTLINVSRGELMD